MKKDLALRALKRAITLRRPKPGLIHHSDRGSQYCATEYQMELKRHGIKISMSGKGKAPGNVVSEGALRRVMTTPPWRPSLKP
ncbi:MAG: hypothetical protein COB46_02815 [Rhodospirillaceae bacterium]|nr:MAG: hypothetical protein COB46_02815 [Rhodospirillaceae bacterium]